VRDFRAQDLRSNDEQKQPGGTCYEKYRVQPLDELGESPWVVIYTNSLELLHKLLVQATQRIPADCRVIGQTSTRRLRFRRQKIVRNQIGVI
jgi:hypothetical protein